MGSVFAVVLRLSSQATPLSHSSPSSPSRQPLPQSIPFLILPLPHPRPLVSTFDLDSGVVWSVFALSRYSLGAPVFWVSPTRGSQLCFSLQHSSL